MGCSVPADGPYEPYEALFSTLESYSLMYFKGSLMRRLEAQRSRLCKLSFQLLEVGCCLNSLVTPFLPHGVW